MGKKYKVERRKPRTQTRRYSLNYIRIFGKKYPEKVKAHKLANQFIEISENQLCERCNQELAKYKHHQDYDKPLEVNFVCINWHKLIHKGE